jgi:hypothetical protein
MTCPQGSESTEFQATGKALDQILGGCMCKDPARLPVEECALAEEVDEGALSGIDGGVV